VISAYPWEENVQIAFEMKEAVPFTYAVRLPGWCPEAQVLVNGKKAGGEEKDGYLYISRKWENEDEWRITSIQYNDKKKERNDIIKPKSIIMGNRISGEDRNKLLQLCDWKDIKLYEIEVDSESYQLRRKQVN